MTISFNSIPNTLRVPFVAVEVDGSQAQQGPALLAYRVLLLGQKTAAGTTGADTLHRATSADAVATLAGRGSQLHRMAAAYFLNNKSTETWVGVLADDGAGVAATGTLTVTGPATAAGTLSLYVAGERVSVGVASDASAATIAASIVAAIADRPNLPVTSAVGGVGSTHVVTLTARNKGTASNDIDIRLNYRDGESTPAGVGVAIVPMAGGATNPSLSGLLAAMGDQWFQVISHPYTDGASLEALETELASRFGPMRMIDGVAITSASGSLSALAALGNGRNSQHSVIVAQPGANPPTPPAEYGAAVAAVVAYHGQQDPARPLQTLPLTGVLAPAEADLFTLEERNLLLFDGVATTVTGPGGAVQVERLITTYQRNAAGSEDTAFLDITTLLTLMYLRYSFRARMRAKYPRHKLADNGTRAGAGQAIITPLVGKAEAVAWFQAMEELGLVEDLDAFKRNLVVERNTLDRNRLDFLLPPNLINQLVVSAASIQFSL